ncbi:serine threonine protein kinase : Serine/threonine protein kinase OS=Planctomyces brasiliensis (strain ATCC 49424 / DSM 5305 / JCM 21570 / NBRC 103401 / IFAM 1448) GN=Plabr_2195 PE=3 SV=1: Pkinase [Gemmataceae bacterium]|nr:serine threonine protein kinase : Serine/threonine protein kinase OS=Planctomyces brasiliensis (strain ATCC 49424 / DSM 5305 / JCM 21570 / NBRC 103401 / IFAM 1448) GN=Plabr_2195 PE=3 SV=1: Pkinase [Gemmataceae bacterium]VTU01232.1 serine threonine protein kinase : Serine/threonine protein kinase OS=Planctomyces brasiliensis (strain ATCC 49424 / DSM 5305 / JCM 21570 / NBRC 103401 / IFAM 1448) GN=Plabr_2195 PE=3 SV=1: Pkinase [Gemmataceae bacterium]
MATPITSVTDFCGLLTKSRLLPADEVEGIHRRWRDENRGDDQVDQFRKFLISRKFLTDWQAHMVQRGRADGFFIGAYKIMDRIGKGQMGGVYKAVHTLGQLVALKILPSSKAKDQHVLGRFQREARLLTQLDHPNVVRSYQFGESNGVHFISMEFLEGETLDEVLTRRKRLPVGEAVRIIHQALGGLQHLHEKRMVHRDLKPANLMLVPSGAAAPAARDRDADTTWDATVKILDIGLGRELFDENVPEGQIETQLTVEGSVLGTPDYLAPEQARDARSADVRADVYSVGCVLYHCVAGRPPFPETNIMTQMLKHATEKPAPLASLVPGAPHGLQAVLDRMLAKRPEDRYQTPAEAADALEPFVGAGAAPAAASVVPAYKEWLESESQFEPSEKMPPLKAGTGANPRAGSGAVPPAKPAKPGTGPAPAVKSGAAPAAPQRPGSGAVAKPVPPRAGKPQKAAPRPAPEEVEVEVELVVEPVAPVMFAPPPEVVYPPERPLSDLDRRDWSMLAIGATGVLFAVGLGYGLARLVRKKQPDDTEEQ